MFVDTIAGYTLWRHAAEWEITDPLGRGYGFATEEAAREWAAHQAGIQGWR
jgi:hypothetical protein